MKQLHKVMKEQHNELNKRVESTHDAFTVDVDDLPSANHKKFAQMHHIKQTTTIMGEKI